MGDNFNLCGDNFKGDKDKKAECRCKVTITVNCCEKKPCCGDDKFPSKDKDGCDVNVVINCCD